MINEYVGINDMLGKKITKVIGGEQDSELYFETECGFTYKMYHEQNCCENVYIEDITGDINDLVGGIVCQAQEDSEDDMEASESGTWTFYKLNTDKWDGGVCIRWYGSSNGYYSEGVSMVKYLTGAK